MLHPYKLVKDARTGHETSDAAGVLEGGELLDGFIRAYLKHRARLAAEERLAAMSS